MKGVQLYPGIRFLAMNDEEGEFGLMIMHDADENVLTHATIENREMFNEVYSRWVPQVTTFYS